MPRMATIAKHGPHIIGVHGPKMPYNGELMGLYLAACLASPEEPTGIRPR